MMPHCLYVLGTWAGAVVLRHGAVGFRSAPLGFRIRGIRVQGAAQVDLGAAAIVLDRWIAAASQSPTAFVPLSGLVGFSG